MYTENVIGQYTTNRWSESLIIFSDKYFEKEYKRIEQTKNEPSKLILIKFDQENKRNLWKEIRTYSTNAYSARTAHPFQRNGAPFRFKLSKAQQVD